MRIKRALGKEISSCHPSAIHRDRDLTLAKGTFGKERRQVFPSLTCTPNVEGEPMGTGGPSDPFAPHLPISLLEAHSTTSFSLWLL